MVENEPVSHDSLTPELWPLLQLWRGKNLMLGRLPCPDDIVPTNTRWLRHVARIVPGKHADFMIQTFGFDLIRRFGRFAGGDRVSSLAPGIRQGLGRMLLLAMRKREPVVWRPAVLLGRDAIHFSELILPLSEDRQGVALLLLAAMEEPRPRPKPPSEPEFYVPDWERD